jgi:hypothetical protein
MTIANELPRGLSTENQILDAAFNLMKEQLGYRTAKYYFCYSEDYPSDVINEYIWLEQQSETTI